MKLISFGAIGIAILGCLATIVPKVHGESFQLKLRWKKKSKWPKANLCAACSNSNCVDGRISLKTCDYNDMSQIWNKSGEKIQSEKNESRCLSFKNPKNVRITPCRSKANSYQKVTEIFSGKKFKIIGMEKCLSVKSNVVPAIGAKLEMRICEKAQEDDAVFWLRSAVTSGPTPEAPNPAPNNPSPVQNPVQGPTYFPFSVVIDSNGSLEKNSFVFSPNKNYKVGLTNDGDLELQDDSSRTIWNAGTSNGDRCFMQTNGDVVIRSSKQQGFHSLWSSKTYKNTKARLIVDDGGQIAVLAGTNDYRWFNGIPRGVYSGPSSNNLVFPVRGIFYYPWYPETWTVKGQLAHFEPDLGWYSSSNPLVAKSHIDSFDYAGVDLSIASWFGAETNLDRARLTMLMDETLAQQSPVKWTVYHEDERNERPSPTNIRVDLDYLTKWFAWHAAWAHVDDRPVIFVYNSEGCDVVKRWMAASNRDWYVVLKLFGGFDKCPIQPDGWHQYGIGEGTLQYSGYSFTIGPGFWHATEDSPRLPRLSKDIWCANVRQMAASRDPWQLIVSFNEAGEGTMIEASSSWKSNTEYGYYLDCLKEYPTIN